MSLLVFRTPRLPDSGLSDLLALHVGTDSLGIDELAIFDVPAHHVSPVRIAVFVKAKLASDPLKILRLTHGLQNSSAVLFASPLDGVERDKARLVGVHGPPNGLRFVLCHIILEKTFANVGGKLIGR